MRRLLPAAALAVALLAACGHTDRPEGVVERWLLSLNQGAAGRPGLYAPEPLSQRVLPHWATRSPGDLDLIEVGQGRALGPPSVLTYAVPFKVVRLDGSTSSGLANVVRRPSWRIDAIVGQAADPTLRVPSEGGTRIGGATAALWLASLGVAAGLILLAAALMRAVEPRRARAVPGSVAD